MVYQMGRRKLSLKMLKMIKRKMTVRLKMDRRSVRMGRIGMRHLKRMPQVPPMMHKGKLNGVPFRT